jgi:thiol-disulfide isomerase/thioredoxin
MSSLVFFSPALSAQTSGVAGGSDSEKTTDYIGRTMSLDFQDLMGSGRFSTTGNSSGSGPARRGTLVVFWSVSCGPCLAEVPELNALNAEWAPRGVSVIGLPQDERPEEVIRLCGKFGIRWPQYLQSGPGSAKPAALEWGITSTPGFILLNGKGIVIDYGFTDPRAALDRHFR